MNFFFDSRKFFPRNLSQNSPNAKVFVKNVAFFLARESFCPRKFLLLKYLNLYDNLLFLGDFNCEVSESPTKTFCGNYTLKNLIKEPTCFKNIENPSSIDVILTNKHRSFMHTKVLETAISDHHKFTVTVMKTKFTKLNPKTVTYRNYKKSNKALFEKELQEMLAIRN